MLFLKKVYQKSTTLILVNKKILVAQGLFAKLVPETGIEAPVLKRIQKQSKPPKFIRF